MKGTTRLHMNSDGGGPGRQHHLREHFAQDQLCTRAAADCLSSGSFFVRTEHVSRNQSYFVAAVFFLTLKSALVKLPKFVNIEHTYLLLIDKILILHCATKQRERHICLYRYWRLYDRRTATHGATER